MKHTLTRWQRTEEHFLAADPDAVFAIVGNLSQTGAWMRSFDGFIVHDDQRGVGTAVDLLPPGRFFGALHRETAPPGSITRRNQPQRLVEFTQPQPGGAMVLRWVVEATEGGSTLHFTVELRGPGTGAFRFTVANALCEDFAVACARLFQLTPTSARTSTEHHVVVAGGRGFLGRRVVADLVCRGISVAVLTRTEEAGFPAEQHFWNGENQGPWTAALTHPSYPVSLINLAGELVDKRNTQDNIALLRDSRVNSTRALADAVAQLQVPLETWIQSSTTAIFGDAGEARLTESSPLPTGDAALPEMTGVAEPWEEAFTQAKVKAAHHYLLRTSLVFAPDAPLLKTLQLLVRTGMGGPVGSGQQWVSWIGLADWLKLVRALLGMEQSRLPSGVVHAASPHPVRNEQMMRALRRSHALPGIGTPTALVKLGANLLGSNPRVALTGRHVTSQVLADAGFHFDAPDLEQLLAQGK